MPLQAAEVERVLSFFQFADRVDKFEVGDSGSLVRCCHVLRFILQLANGHYFEMPFRHCGHSEMLRLWLQSFFYNPYLWILRYAHHHFGVDGVDVADISEVNKISYGCVAFQDAMCLF